MTRIFWRFLSQTVAKRSARLSESAVTGTTVRTVAVRYTSYKVAISPKKEPFPSLPTTVGLPFTRLMASHSPCSMTYSLSPNSPSETTFSYLAKVQGLSLPPRRCCSSAEMTSSESSGTCERKMPRSSCRMLVSLPVTFSSPIRSRLTLDAWVLASFCTFKVRRSRVLSCHLPPGGSVSRTLAVNSTEGPAERSVEGPPASSSEASQDQGGEAVVGVPGFTGGMLVRSLSRCSRAVCGVESGDSWLPLLTGDSGGIFCGAGAEAGSLGASTLDILLRANFPSFTSDRLKDTSGGSKLCFWQSQCSRTSSGSNAGKKRSTSLRKASR
mmetsp:Transcript_25453/g.73011  ORF Transcript_25453/g.73011 Transcript_25453/m.73011 type:complete len:326 (-) Transcript_25453:64-1041(-)